MASKGKETTKTEREMELEKQLEAATRELEALRVHTSPEKLFQGQIDKIMNDIKELRSQDQSIEENRVRMAEKKEELKNLKAAYREKFGKDSKGKSCPVPYILNRRLLFLVSVSNVRRRNDSFRG